MHFDQARVYMVARAGIEPATQGFSIHHLKTNLLILLNYLPW